MIRAKIPRDIPKEELEEERKRFPKIFPVRHREEIIEGIEELADIFVKEHKSPDPEIPFESFVDSIEQEILDELFYDHFVYHQSEWTKEISDYARSQIIGRYNREIVGMRKVVYYAHCMKDYHTPKAEAHKKMLMKMGFSLIDPSQSSYVSVVEDMKKEGKSSSEIMDFFVNHIKGHADLLAFATTDEGKVSAGVAKEIETMKKKNGLVIQMPNLDNLKVMSIDETRRYLKST